MKKRPYSLTIEKTFQIRNVNLGDKRILRFHVPVNFEIVNIMGLFHYLCNRELDIYEGIEKIHPDEVETYAYDLVRETYRDLMESIYIESDIREDRIRTFIDTNSFIERSDGVGPSTIPATEGNNISKYAKDRLDKTTIKDIQRMNEQIKKEEGG